jgi:nicotinamidase-related amidase
MGEYIEPHFSRSALITIDTQNDFTLDGAPVQIEGTKEIIPNMVSILNAYRKHQLPIIHVIRLYALDGGDAELCRKDIIEKGQAVVAPGSTGADLVDALKPDADTKLNEQELLSGQFQKIGPNEFIMYKPRWGAFYKTALEDFLHDRGVDTLVFTGCNFPNCPRSSIYQASERDFRIALVADAISQLYEKGEDELRAIGVRIITTKQLNFELDSRLNQAVPG